MSYQLGRFEGKPLLGQMEDPYRGTIINAFYIDREDVVGLYDGIDSWIGQVGACCFKMNLEKAIENMHNGELIPRKERRKVVDKDDDAPDRFCITTADGNCISEDPRCMHQIPHRSTSSRRRIHVD